MVDSVDGWWYYVQIDGIAHVSEIATVSIFGENLVPKCP